MIVRIIQGTTVKDFRLRDDTQAVNGVGLQAPTLVMTDRLGHVVDTTGAVAWLVAAEGTVRVTLGNVAMKLDRSPFRARFRLADAAANNAYYPDDDEPMLWQLTPAP